jgi:hypothetical protein
MNDTRRAHDPLNTPDIEPSTYEIRFAAGPHEACAYSVVAVTVTVRAFTRMDAIRLARQATGRPRSAIESSKEV